MIHPMSLSRVVGRGVVPGNVFEFDGERFVIALDPYGGYFGILDGLGRARIGLYEIDAANKITWKFGNDPCQHCAEAVRDAEPMRSARQYFGIEDLQFVEPT